MVSNTTTLDSVLHSQSNRVVHTCTHPLHHIENTQNSEHSRHLLTPKHKTRGRNRYQPGTTPNFLHSSPFVQSCWAWSFFRVFSPGRHGRSTHSVRHDITKCPTFCVLPISNFFPRVLNRSYQEWPRQTKPKKGQSMNFSQGHSGTKVRESCLFS